MFRPKEKHPIFINSSPEGADVIIRNKKVGTTPMEYVQRRRKRDVVRISKEGYADSITRIKLKVHPGWLAASLGMNLLNFEIGFAVDYKTGAIFRVVTDSIYSELKPYIKTDKERIDVKNMTNPSVEILTGNTQYILQKNTVITVRTISGDKIRSRVRDVQSNYFSVYKKKQNVFFDEIESIRIYNNRRWYPIAFGFAIVPPISWHATSVKLSTNNRKCFRKIRSITTIDYKDTRAYGKAGCK
jgi:hypothetical protein